MKKIEFYFDFLSPYSYFAWLRLEMLTSRQDIELEIKPCLLAGLLNHYETKGPAEIDPKREFLFRECLRYAAKNNIEFTTPKFHPFNPLYALRMALIENSGKDQIAVINTIWKAGWQKRADLGNPDQLVNELKEANLPADEIYERTFDREVKQALKRNTKEAIEKRCFGVPSFVVDGEVFWGNHSLEDLISYLDGNDVLDREKYEDLKKRTAKAARQSL
jgi:2-hydroxychromene-2-carboxylate isomerase